MKQFLYVFLLLFVCSAAYAQVPNQTARRLRSGTTDPNTATLACNPGPPYTDIFILTTDHSEWQCTAAPHTWTKVTSGSPASGTIGGSSGSVDRGLILANGTGGSTVQGSSTTLSSAGVFGFVNNQRQVFSPGSQRAGLNVGSVGTDPSIQSNGDIWYNTTAFQLRAIVNGSVVNIGGGGTIGGSGTLNTLAKFTPDGARVGNSRITDADDIVIGTQEDPDHPFIFLDFTNNNFEFGSGNIAGGQTQIYGGNPNVSIVLLPDPAITAAASTESLAIDGAAHTIIQTAATAITLDAPTITATSLFVAGGDILPLNAGGSQIGSTDKPLSKVLIGLAAGQTVSLEAGSTGNRVATFPDATGTVLLDSLFNLSKTITAGGTTGAQTINKYSGSVNFAAAATSLVVTNSLVGTSSVVTCTVATNDTTMKSVACVAASGSFTIFSNAAATAETRVNFRVSN